MINKNWELQPDKLKSIRYMLPKVNAFIKDIPVLIGYLDDDIDSLCKEGVPAWSDFYYKERFSFYGLLSLFFEMLGLKDEFQSVVWEKLDISLKFSRKFLNIWRIDYDKNLAFNFI